MKDQSETKKQLLAEREGLRREIERLRKAEAKHERAASKLKESEERFRLIFEQSPIGAALVGLDGRFQQANPQMCRFLGYSQKELASLTVLEVTHPEDQEMSRLIIKDLMDGKREHIQQLEKRYLRKDKSTIWGRASVRLLKTQDGQTVCRLAMLEDISRQKQAEEALRRSEGAKTAIFDAMTEFVIFQDQDHRVLWANKAAADAARTGLDGVIGCRCHEALSQSETECPGCPVAKAFATKQFAEATVTTPHDRVRLVRANPVPDHQGKVSGVVAVSLDITEQKKAEQEKERLILELKRALGEVKKLSGLLPICASCKKIRNDQGYWEQIESYISSHSEADFSHGICPDCKRKLYPELDKHKLEPFE